MSSSFKTPFLVALGLSFLAFCAFLFKNPHDNIPIVAIANYGPHASLHETISGIKDELKTKGLVENKDFRFEIL
ncbi:MAG: hypothetical protein AB7V32_08850, partial [Candidatus Berkiella sp.]